MWYLFPRLYEAYVGKSCWICLQFSTSSISSWARSSIFRGQEKDIKLCKSKSMCKLLCSSGLLWRVNRDALPRQHKQGWICLWFCLMYSSPSFPAQSCSVTAPMTGQHMGSHSQSLSCNVMPAQPFPLMSTASMETLSHSSVEQHPVLVYLCLYVIGTVSKEPIIGSPSPNAASVNYVSVGAGADSMSSHH